jgi:hypothetical protein
MKDHLELLPAVFAEEHVMRHIDLLRSPVYTRRNPVESLSGRRGGGRLIAAGARIGEGAVKRWSIPATEARWPET